jgi:bifunctional DNA-binding transcriptional regulator/antitoxin component of YhaV-PrlF toxin-antitoxin module
MRLQRQVSRKTERKEYSKYVVVIPPEKVEKLGWKEGEELEEIVRGDSLTIRKSVKRAET